MDISKLKIDKEFESLLAPLATDEIEGLTEAVKRDGFTDPLIAWLGHSLLVDGHNRYRIWVNELGSDDGKAPEIIEKSFATRNDVKEFILRRQLSRRNLNDAQRVQLTLQLKPIVEAKAKESRKANEGRPGKKKLSTILSTVSKVDTRQELAALAGVSEGTFAKAEAVLKSDNEDLKASMLSGKTKISAAHKAIKDPPPASSPAVPVTHPKPKRWDQGASTLPDVREHAPEDDESDGLFLLKQAWRRASKRDRKSFKEWISTQ